MFNDNFVIAGDLVQLLLHHDEFGDCFFFTVAASLLYRMCMGCMVRYFPFTRFTVPFVPLVGVSLPYRVRVLFQYTPYGKVVSVHTVYSTRVLFLPSARHYSIIRMYSTPVHAASYGNFGASLFVPYCVHVHVACCYTVPFVPFVPCAL